MADTKITRLRNIMTPIVNYFAMQKLAMKATTDTPPMADLIFKERLNCLDNIDEICEILKQIPDNACDGIKS